MTTRRAVLGGLAAIGGLAAWPALRGAPMTSSSRVPALFVAHGAPPLLDDAGWMAELRAWGEGLRGRHPIRAVLVVSAHWEQRPAALGSTRSVPLVYDYYNFPERFYRIQYPSPGAPELADRVEGLLRAAGVGVARSERGLDHGVFIPLMAMFPAADLPVLQLSLPSLRPAEVLAMGRALAPLRDEGVLVIGSGFLVHNLRVALSPGATPAFVGEFDAWAAEAIARRDVDALANFEAVAPAARLAHPTTEHYLPLLVAMGAADGATSFPITGEWFKMTKRSVEIA
jgi:4,5-DOPA dioxygenase extradiol